MISLAALRQKIAGLPLDRPITEAERDDLLDCATPNDLIFARAYRHRCQLQKKNWPLEKAIHAAIRKFESNVDNVPALEKAVRNPNGRIRKILPTIESETY